MAQRIQRDADEIRRLYVEEKYSMRDIAEIVGCGTRIIARELLGLGIPRRSRSEQAKIDQATRGRKPERRPRRPRQVRDLDKIKQLYVDERLSMKAIARQIGCGDCTIKRDLVAAGVTVRGKWEQRKIDEAAGRAITQAERIKQRHKDGCYANAMTPERRKRISEFASQRIGEKNSFFGKKHSKETRAKISVSAKQRVGEKNPFHGRKHSLETRLKISACHGGDGVTFIPKRGYPEEWTVELRESIRDREGYRCLMCGKPQGKRKLSVHHVDYDRWNNDEGNLVALCIACHCKTNVRRKAWIAFFGAFGLGPERRPPFA